jgi:hypothetical protein
MISKITKKIDSYIEKFINDNLIQISDYRIYASVKPSADISDVNYLTKILNLSEKDYFLMLFSGAFVKGFNKRGFTYKQAKNILKKVILNI